MKCTFCQNPLEEDCDFCSNCGREVFSIRKIVLCIGKKKNGSLCGAELQIGKHFCKKCGVKVDQSIFEKEEVLCANCGCAFADDEDFCVECGFPRNGISVYLAELIIGSESNSSRMEAVESSKFDQNQSDEKAKNRKENQTSDALVDKAHGTKSESEEDKSQTSTMKQGLGEEGSNVTRTGNKGKSVDVVRVHFHSLVSAEFGLTSTDVVIIRFGEDELGGWNSDTHRPKLVRKYGDEYTEFKLVLDIPKRLFARSKQIHYKYVISRNKAHKVKASYVWEFYGIHMTAGRTLDLPDLKNIVHWYDGIIFPKPGEGLWNTAKDIKERVKRDLVQCIEYFLPRFFQDVSRGQLPEVSVEEALNQLEDLLHSLKRVYCVDWECYSKPSDYQNKVSTATVSCIFKSLESETEIPLSGYIETQQQAERRMQVALFVLTVIGRFKLLLSPRNKSFLARSLLLRPHHETGTFHDLAVVVEISHEERRKLQAYIIEFCGSFPTNDKDPSWLCCIPLLHLLSGVVKPYQPPTDNIRHDEHDPRWWGIQSVESTAENFKQCSKDWLIALEDIIRCLSPLFELDYFLPRMLMYVLQLKEVELVIQTGTFPPEVCIATCIYYIKETISTLTTVHNQIISCTKVLREFLAKFEAPGRWSDLFLLQHAYLTQRIAMDMVRITFESLYPHDLIREVVQVFLEAVALYDITQEKLNRYEPKDTQIHMLTVVHTMVKKWLSRFVLICCTESLKRWQDMLCSKDFRSPAVAGMWNAFIGDDLKKQQEYKQLQDLQSRLMLVAEPAEQGKDNVDRFSTVCMEFKTEVAGEVLNHIKITNGKKGIDSLVSSLKKFAKVDTCDDKIHVFCDSKHAEDVQRCVTSHYNKTEKERTSPKEITNKYLINGGNDNLKEWLEFAFSHTSWSKNLEIEEGKLYLLGSEQMKREVEEAVQSINHWYQEEFTLTSEEQQKTDEVVTLVKNELPAIFIKQTREKIAVLSDNEENIERVKYKVNMALGRIKITGRRRNHTNPQTYNKPFSDACMSKDDRMDAGLTLPSSSFHSNQAAVDLAAKSYCTKEGLTTKVYLGDLRSLPVDCIVNAANELLSHDGGVALAISKAAGRDFDQEGKEYVKKHGAIPVTQCCVTSSGNLPYNVVIHAVGPRWSDYKYNEKERCTEDLKKTIVNCLIEANKFKMASIAIPSLSSGIFGVPKPLCAQMYAKAVVEYSIIYGLQSVKEIHFVDMITDMCQLTQLALEAELQ